MERHARNELITNCQYCGKLSSSAMLDIKKPTPIYTKRLHNLQYMSLNTEEGIYKV